VPSLVGPRRQVLCRGFELSLIHSGAFLCGLISVHQGRLGGRELFMVLTGWLVADLLLGELFSQWVALKVVAGQVAVAWPRAAQGPFFFPYAQREAPGWRLAATVNSLWLRWRKYLWPTWGSHLRTAFACVVLALVLGTWLGRRFLLFLSGGVWIAALLDLLAGKNAPLFVRGIAGLRLSLAWCLGALVLASPGWGLLGVVALVGLAAYAQTWERAGGGRRATVLVNLVWGILIVSLLLAKQPGAATFLALTAVLERAFSWKAGDTWLARKWQLVPWLAAQFCLALALAHWGG